MPLSSDQVPLPLANEPSNVSDGAAQSPDRSLTFTLPRWFRIERWLSLPWRKAAGLGPEVYAPDALV